MAVRVCCGTARFGPHRPNCQVHPPGCCDPEGAELPRGCEQHPDLADWCSVHDQDGSVCRMKEGAE